jgi:hypothetical protein
MSAEIPLSVQIAEAQRELKLRRDLYPAWIAAGKLKQKVANNRIDIMAEIVRTLTDLREQQLAQLEQLGSSLLKQIKAERTP